MDVISSSPFAAAAEVLKRADAQDLNGGSGAGAGEGSGSGLRRAKDLAAFTSLLPPAVEFVEGSSRGALASLEGRYEPINVPPKAGEEKEEGEKREGEQNRRGRSASVNGKLVNGNDKVRVSASERLLKSSSVSYCCYSHKLPVVIMHGIDVLSFSFLFCLAFIPDFTKTRFEKRFYV